MSDLSQGSMPISGNITHTRKTISQLLEERGLSTGVPMPLSVNVDTDPSERYQIGRLIATGGVAEIFEAVDTGSRRVMAMKVMSPGKISNDADLVRFVEEAQITAQLEHPGIPPVYDFGVDADGNVYYTMKLVPGRTLEAILSDIREGKQETIRKYGLARLLSILMQVCDAVEYAHSRGVIHRNLKPENIMVGSYDDVQVMDWGVAKVLPNRGVTDRRTVDQTVDGEMIGTPEYMAPEQAYGKISEMDERSDVYALGGVLYAILTLRPPATGNQVNETLLKIVEGNLVSPQVYSDRSIRVGPQLKRGGAAATDNDEIPLWHCPRFEIHPALTKICLRALALKPGARYERVRDLRHALDKHRGAFGLMPTDESFLAEVFWLFRQHPYVSALAAGILTALVALMGLAGTNYLGEIGQARDTTVANERQSELMQKEIARLRPPEIKTTAPRKPTFTDPRDVWGYLGRELAAQPDSRAMFWLDRGRLALGRLELNKARDAFDKVRLKAEDNEPVLRLLRHYERLHRNVAQRLAYANPLERPVPFPGDESEREDELDRQLLTIRKELTVALEELKTANPGLNHYKLAVSRAGVQVTLDGPTVTTLAALKGQLITSLYLLNTNLTSLEPLRGMPLRHLKLYQSSEVTELAPLARMPLDSLDIAGTAVSDLGPLAGIALKRLYADQTSVADLAPLKGMPLVRLSIGQTRVWDLGPLHGLPLEQLSISGTKVRDLSALRGMPLTVLEANMAPVRDLSPLRGLRLEKLFLQRTEVVNLTPLLGQSITTLNLRGTKVRDLTPLAGLPLEQLYLDGCPEVDQLRPLIRCQKLRTLTIPRHVSDIDQLRYLSELEFLSTTHIRKPARQFWKEREQ